MPTLESRVVDALRRERLTLACAESCTGGLLGARLTRVPGASDVFLGGVICYHDDVKTELLGVDRETLRKEGAATREIAKAMAEGARQLLGADVALGITGFAGPHVPPGAELGRVHIAVAHWGGIEPHDLRFPDEREKVREGAVEESLRLLLEAVDRVARAAR